MKKPVLLLGMLIPLLLQAQPGLKTLGMSDSSAVTPSGVFPSIKYSDYAGEDA